MEFQWDSSVTSDACWGAGGDEAAVRLGTSLQFVDIPAGKYPGNPSRPQADDGHFVEVTLLGDDSCLNCTPIGVGTFTGATAQATQDGSSSCDTGTGKDVWYCYKPDCNGMVDIDTCGSSYDTVLSVHNGCPGNAGNEHNIDIGLGRSCDDCAGGVVPCGTDDSCGSFYAYVGQTYWIRVAGVSGDAGAFVLHLNNTPDLTAANNDEYTNAIPISLIGSGPIIGSAPTYGTTNGATPSFPAIFLHPWSPPLCGKSLNAPDVWYSVAPQCSGPITVQTCNCPCPSSLWYDTVLSVYTPLWLFSYWWQLACNDDNCSAPSGSPPVGCDPTGTAPPRLSKLTFSGTGGFPQLIRVSGFAGATGDFRLDVSQTLSTPSNNLCASAITVPNGTRAFSTCGATTSPAPPGCTVNQDIWYKWVAPLQCSGTVTVDTCGSLFDTSVAVYSGSCTGSLVACNDNAPFGSACFGTQQSSVSFAATPGGVYFIRVGAPDTGMGSGQLTISGPNPAPSTCPLPTNPPTKRLFTFVGTADGGTGAWCLRAPCCFQRQDLSVAGAYNLTDLVANFVDSVNTCGVDWADRLVAKAVGDPANGQFKIIAHCGPPAPGWTTSSPLAVPQFELRVGKGGTVSSCDQLPVVGPVGTVLIPTSYNPDVYEIPLSGVDCNGNGEDDLLDILEGTSLDANGNGIPDECDVACIADADCGDGNACTADVCDTKIGFCVHTSSVPAGQCCNPVNGAMTPLDDGNPCTTDVCDVATGAVSYTPAPIGTACDDGLECTYADSCDGAGVCTGLDVNTIPCVIDDDCPAGPCDPNIGLCQCTPASPGCPLPPGEDICMPRLLLGDCQNGGPNDFCRPTQWLWPVSGPPIVTKCDCLSADECYIGDPFAGFTCHGSTCPLTGAECPLTATATLNPDGTTTYECCPECRPDGWISDSPNPPVCDTGAEPDDPSTSSCAFTVNMWESDDIRVRHSPPASTDPWADSLAHENPIYPGPNAVFVRLRSLGTCNVSGDIKLYFAEAAIGLSWQSNWTLIGTQTATVGPTPAEYVAKFTWLPPPPGLTGHFCLLARFVSLQDPMKCTEDQWIEPNTRCNNNIAWKNVIVVTDNNRMSGNGFLVRNVKNLAANVDVVFNSAGGGDGIPFLDGGSVRVALTPEMFNNWMAAGGQGQGIIVGHSDVSLTSPLAKIQGIPMGAYEAQLVTMYFTPNDESPPPAFQRFVVSQFYDGQTTPDGGVTFEFRFGQELIPTVSEWGLVVLTVLLLIGGRIYFARRQTATAS